MNFQCSTLEGKFIGICGMCFPIDSSVHDMMFLLPRAWWLYLRATIARHPEDEKRYHYQYLFYAHLLCQMFTEVCDCTMILFFLLYLLLREASGPKQMMRITQKYPLQVENVSPLHKLNKKITKNRHFKRLH